MRHTRKSLPSVSRPGRVIQRLLLLALVVLAASALSAPTAFAQDDPCAENPADCWGGKYDPAGVIYDRAQYDAGRIAGKSAAEARTAAAIKGATVRLQREVDGEFRDVRSGDAGISPSADSQITGDGGGYQWNVAAGNYRVVVSKDGYETSTSQGVRVPPPVTDLHVAMTRTAPPSDGNPLALGLTLAAAALMIPFGAKVGRRLGARR